MLMLRADGDRVEELKALGQQLQANARAQVEDASSPGAPEYLAAVRTWADTLDRSAYETAYEDDRILVSRLSTLRSADAGRHKRRPTAR
jgi:hypothetical protein